MDYIMDYPPSLIDRIQQDQEEALTALALPEPPSLSVPAIRELSHRKLLAATPDAIDTITKVMRTGSKKDRLEASKTILDRSPATEQTVSIGGESLPSEILKPLMDVFASFARAALVPLQTQSPLPLTNDASDVIVTVIKEPSNAQSKDPVLVPKKTNLTPKKTSRVRHPRTRLED
jgi:hypothetical protein